MPIAAVHIENLSRRYEDIVAVDDVSFTVKQGELFGFIGPDGAGKTTLMRILCGLLSPHGGGGRIFDHDLIAQMKEIRKILGYMPQRFSLYADLTVAENLRFFADLFHVARDERETRLRRLLEFSRLGPFQNRRASDLSGGMKQKLALSCTLIHTPRLLILDEPTTGVDPVSRREFWSILHELLGQGVTILVSTPYMDEAQKCHSIALMHRGKILTVEKPGDIASHFRKSLYEIESSDLYGTMDQLSQLPFVQSPQLFGDKIHIIVEEDPGIEKKLRSANIGIRSMSRIDPSVEDVFIELMKK